MDSAWNGNIFRKFQNGDNVVYIQDGPAMEVFEKIDGSKKLIRSIDYYDHVEI